MTMTIEEEYVDSIERTRDYRDIECEQGVHFLSSKSKRSSCNTGCLRKLPLEARSCFIDMSGRPGGTVLVAAVSRMRRTKTPRRTGSPRKRFRYYGCLSPSTRVAPLPPS